MNIRKHIPTIIVVVILLISIGISLHYTLQDQEALIISDLSISDTRREEIQRYFGYEPLISRYMTLPYDISINTNQQGTFVDIGFLYIILLPIVLLSVIKGITFKWLAVSVLFSLLVLSIHNSFILVDTIKVGTSELADISSMEGYDSMDMILTPVYKVAEILYTPYGWLVDTFSGDQDYITYPILISSFLFFLFLFYRLGQKSKRIASYLILTSITYSFFFLAFSSGIIWYGYLLFPLLLIGLMYFVDRQQNSKDKLKVTARVAISALSILWIGMSLVSRISNLQVNIPVEHQGKSIISPDVYHYNTGRIKSISELQDKFIAPQFSEAIDRINSRPNTKILKIGTGISYFIDNNHERVIYDNQLGLFSRIVNNYRNKYIISDFLKASGVHYLIIDLNTPSIDNTPEQTLTTKYRELLSYLSENDSLQLLCTDNITKDSGTNNYSYSLSGETLRRGSFAIYEIN